VREFRVRTNDDLKIAAEEHAMKRIPWTVVSITGLAIGLAAVVGSKAMSVQDRSTLRVPNGLAFSEFKGFEDWATIGVSQTGNLIEVILGNPIMMTASRAGLPANGKQFPEGARMAKIHWNATKSAESPSPTTVQDTLHDIDFMAKDSKRFADSGGWGYAQFNYDAATDTFTPLGNDAKCGFACHTIVASKDYVFSSYGKR
jgi:hypothetical protein